jgi:PAS domain S-box-containing protein
MCSKSKEQGMGVFIFSWIAELLSKLILKRLGEPAWDGAKVLIWRIRRSPKTLTIGALLFLLCFLICGFQWFRNGAVEENALRSTLTTELEPTRQAFEGLEAFVLSDLRQAVDASLHKSEVREDFDAAFKVLQGSASLAPESPSPIELIPTGAINSPNKFISDSGNGFLFATPMTLKLSTYTDEDIKKAATEDSHFAADVRFSQAIADQLYALLNTPVFDTDPAAHLQIPNTPVQAYVITRKGVLRIFERNVTDQRAYYKGQFDWSTLFPSEPYFQAALDKSSTLKKGPSVVTEYFHVTGPYVDRGGNGVIVTLCKPLKTSSAPLVTPSVLCLDISLGDVVRQSIETRLKGLGGRALDSQCEVGNGVSCKGLPEGTLTKSQHDLIQGEVIKLNQLNRLSEIFGKIRVLDPAKIAFTIPLGTPDPAELKVGSRGCQLLYCELNPDHIAMFTSLTAAGAGAGLVGFVACVVLLYVGFHSRLRQMKVAFEKVGKVMLMVPVAYCQLDEHDRFEQVNNAFAELTGRTSESLVDGKVKFEELLADDASKALYKTVLERRSNRQSVDPYSLQIIAAQGKQVTVEIHSADIPAPRGMPTDLPKTFGVVLPKSLALRSAA